MQNIITDLNQFTWLIYVLPLFLVWMVYGCGKYLQSKRAITRKKQAITAGLIEPPSLHPIINQSICIGCNACTYACPEGDILGLINGKAQLVNPANCIGHGACKTACPVDAISLVFGSEKRGVEIPVLSPNFETNVPGIFIAGELGGMGLIRNAIEQGKQAAQAAIKLLQKQHSMPLDLVIVGAGPAGISASLAAKAAKINFVSIDQDSLGGTVAHFPRNKIVMTSPVDLPLVGKVKIKETSKEALLAFWQQVIEDTQLTINFTERLEKVETLSNGFMLTTSKNIYHARSVLLCLGRRGTPRKLGVEGEHLEKVVYRMIDPAQYQNQHVLIVGGGDSALEAATSIASQTGTVVTLCYRHDSFSRAKPKNRDKLDQAIQNNNLKLMLNSNVKSITEKAVEIIMASELVSIANDAVIVCAGGILPTPFLKEIGIVIETKHGTA